VDGGHDGSPSRGIGGRALAFGVRLPLPWTWLWNEGAAMKSTRSVREWMAERGLSLEALLAGSLLDKKVLEAIIEGRYTPSPQQRQRVADALGVAPEDIEWGHVNTVSHVYGHGPQFGRSP